MTSSDQPVALLCSEPLRERMAGIGIRYFEMARRLPALGLPVRLLSPFPDDDARRWIGDRLDPSVEVVPVEPERLGQQLEGCRAVVAQGQLANDVVHRAQEVPLVVDLYDPWLVENFHYVETLGLDPYRNDHATWMLQLAAGDLFLCSSEEQRLFYTGLLVAVGRVHPRLVADDPALSRLLRIVPFGVPAELPEHRPVIEVEEGADFHVLFGGLYDWYDPWPLLEGFERGVREGREGWRLLLVHNPDAATPQRLAGEVVSWIRRRGLDGRIRFLDWVPAERRYDLLRDVDVLAATHRDSLETRLSLRTRFLDALAVGLPILTTEGGTVSRLLDSHGAGWVLPEGDAGAVHHALVEIATDAAERQRRVTRSLELGRSFHWDRVLEPLVEFLRSPWRDATRLEFSRVLPTVAPPDPLGFRVRRKLRRWLGGGP